MTTAIVDDIVTPQSRADYMKRLIDENAAVIESLKTGQFVFNVGSTNVTLKIDGFVTPSPGRK